jgi:hypothetical protein
VPVETIRYNLPIEGAAREKAQAMMGSARQGIGILKDYVKFNNLQSGEVTRKFNDGSIIRISTCFGAIRADIIPMMEVHEERKYKEEETLLGDNTLVYLGTDFSEYTMDSIVKECLRHWSVVPQENLDGLTDRLLLVLPCPKRILTDNELAIIKVFLSSSASRIFMFPGSSITFVNLILKQLDSCLELVAITGANTTIYRMNGLLPDSTLISLPASLPAWIGVNESSTHVPIVRDINGFGVWYDGICSLSYLGYYTPPDSLTEWVFGPEIIEKINSGTITIGWTINPDYVSPFYTKTYTDKTEDEYLTWYNPYLTAGIAPMTKSVADSYSFTRNAKGWRDFADLGICNFVESLIAFVPSERIVLCGLVPAWLTNTYAKEITTTDAFCKWLVYGTLENKDNFKQKYFMMPWPAMPRISGWVWPTPPIQE